MFRSPLDDSSSSDSGPENQDKEVCSPQSSTGIIDRRAVATESLSGSEEYSVTNDQDNEDQPDLTHHSNMSNTLMASLLEDFCRVRAAELLNAGSQENFTRNSPEVQPLAAKMFAHNSKMLATNNLLPDLFAREQMQVTRKKVLAGIDSIGLQALQDADMQGGNQLTGNHPSTALQRLALPTSPYDFTNLLTAPMSNLAIRATSIYSAPSPFLDAQLSTRALSRPGRYHSDFSQVKLLGQGGFGQVFHVTNHVDNQNYAIKRIPLSAKVLLRWTDGIDPGARIFQEIRTLAKVEHCNIVRYYGAWLESPSVSQEDGADVIRRSSADRRMITDRPALVALSNASRGVRRQKPSEETSGGIVFGEDSVSTGTKKTNIQEVSRSDLPQSTSAISIPDSDIFSDGRSRSIIATDSLPAATGHVLCIQMSLHPISLTNFLSIDSKRPKNSAAIRHCYHLIPSLRLLLGIICGLQYLHALGIVHRDIKPGNILLSEPPSPVHYAAGYYDVGSCASCPGRTPYFLNPRIADFGLVAEIERSVDSMETSSGGKVVGTEFYKGPSSPDTIARVDEKLDVFALGIVLFELVWRIGTKMERGFVLGNLSQRTKLPDNFEARIDAEGEGCGAKAAKCILGMVDRDSDRRWSCEQVKTWVEGMLIDLENKES